MKRPTVPPPNLRLPRGKRTPLAAAASLAGHLILVLLVFGVARAGQPFLREEDFLAELGGGGGGGGRQIAFLALPAPRVPEAEPVPVVERTEVREPVVMPPPVEMPTEIPPPTDLPAPLDTIPRTADSAASGGGAGSGGGVGTGSGTGIGPGVGPGSGPGSGGTGGGDGGLARPPEPRRMILPPFDYPRTMRGRTIAVTFFVEADGRVARVTFAPEVPDRGFAKKLEDVMRAYRFRPARSAEGVPIPGTTTVSVTF